MSPPPAAIALTGVLLFVAAVSGPAEALRIVAGDRSARAVAPVCAVVASVGISLGRALRWNSGDVVVRPLGGLEATAPFLGNPGDRSRAATARIPAPTAGHRGASTDGAVEWPTRPDGPRDRRSRPARRAT